MPAKQPTSLRLSMPMRARIADRANHEGITSCELMRKAIDHYLDSRESLSTTTTTNGKEHNGKSIRSQGK